MALLQKNIELVPKVNTGGPCYMRSFYLHIRVYAIDKYGQKFNLCKDFASPPSHIYDLKIFLNEKSDYF